MDTLVQSKATLKTPAYAAQQANAALAPWSIERREPGPHDVLIDILYCGVCHSDIHQVRDEWGNSIFPMVPGHEIVGRVRQGRRPREEVEGGRHRRRRLLRRFLPHVRGLPGGRGAILRDGHDARPTTATSATARRRPMAATRPASPSTRITCCASRRAFRSSAPRRCFAPASPPIRRCGTSASRQGDKLGVVGLGGLGHMAVKFGQALGAHVTVLSHSPGKRDDALRARRRRFRRHRATRPCSSRTPAVSISSSTRSPPRTTTTPISTCCAATAPWCWWECPEPTPLSAFPLIVKRQEPGRLADRRHSRDPGDAGLLRASTASPPTSR